MSVRTSFWQDDISLWICKALEQAGADPRLLVLEVAEFRLYSLVNPGKLCSRRLQS
jgi:hypothetical protein